MGWLLVVSFGGWLAGFLLLRKVPVIPKSSSSDDGRPVVTLIMPCRNEESNLSALLHSAAASDVRPNHVIVVDDHSTDGTSEVATRFGARVLRAKDLPQGWTGKTWACQQGADAAESEALLFLDADTRFAPDGYSRITGFFATLPEGAALSLLPFHRTEQWYEELSLFFNILMAMGAGGFGGIDTPRLFGQSMLLRKNIYARAGGHAVVKKEILENLHFAPYVRAAGGTTFTAGGRGVLEIRMFPQGPVQLCESWRKAFVSGAGATSPQVLALSICWLTAAMLAAMVLLMGHGIAGLSAAALYLAFVAQIGWYARQLGTFRWLTSLLYPLPLLFYFVVFGQSAWLRVSGRPVVWKGRRM